MGNAGPTIRVEGARELRRTMKKAGVDVSDMKDANQKAGQIVASAGAGMAPRRTGRLAGSIRPARQVSGVVIRAGGASLPYAGVIHWGWPRRHIRSRPFLVDAAHSTEPEWIGAYWDGVLKAMAQVRGA